ncbi:MAG: DUF1508 domain-containing protein, partial [Hydrogenophaga sp.]|nr:DUF1508 domain-containing protein [Hydrogenophaga sp.]
GPAKAAKSAAPAFKQYRESDGQFYFKLLNAQGKLMLQSKAFAAPREAAQAIQRLQQLGTAGLADLSGQISERASDAEVAAALQHFAQNVT